MKEGPSAPEGELTKGAGDQPESAEVKQESELKTQVDAFVEWAKKENSAFVSMLAHHGEIELQGTLEEAEASVPEGMFIKKGGTKEAPQYTLCYHMHSGTIEYVKHG